MAHNQDILHRFYKKDGEGAPFAIQQAVFDGKIVEYPAGFPDVSNILTELQSFSPREDDVLLITYPKSGSHWLYEIVDLLQRGELTHSQRAPVEDMLEFKTSLNRRDKTKPMVSYTHLRKCYFPQNVLRKQKVIYGVRNPKSVMASCQSHMKRGKVNEYEGSLTGFLPVFKNGFYNIWGNWFQHVTEYWSELKDYKNAHIVFFEDFKKDTLKQTMEISQFLGYNRSEEFCKEVVKMTDLAHMKQVEGEREKEFTEMYWKKGEEGFVREGQVGGWQERLPEAVSKEIDALYEKELEKYPDLKKRIQFH